LEVCATLVSGSSSIKFALFEADGELRRIRIEGIAFPRGSFTVKGSNDADNASKQVVAPAHTPAVAILIACFDTAFHHNLPRVAPLLPIPRRYDARGVRRYGFHGLSCAWPMEELARVAGAKAAQGRVILAHLGNGASITAACP
jgi:acetate kinase